MLTPTQPVVVFTCLLEINIFLSVICQSSLLGEGMERGSFRYRFPRQGTQLAHIWHCFKCFIHEVPRVKLLNWGVCCQLTSTCKNILLFKNPFNLCDSFSQPGRLQTKVSKCHVSSQEPRQVGVKQIAAWIFYNLLCDVRNKTHITWMQCYSNSSTVVTEDSFKW